ncbi:hypothetical protein [Aestuariibacter salexigens]|uniref:hypothetical protein n=1 Tax=Aestuariibacter salexigens TaxID=226010 RepID=UPI0004043942|nr:hypothetical protein [Aestuariibacter salexigens]
MLRSTHRQTGATLVELMIAMALGISALAALASLVGYGMGINAKLLANSRLNEELGNVMSLMTRDIRRAGFNGNTLAMVSDPVANPSAFTGSMALGEFLGETANSCITYAYDNNSDGVLNAVAGNNENYGFRLRNQMVEMRVNGLACGDDGWEPLTDPNAVSVTGLTFALNQVVENGVTSTEVTVSLLGELTSDSDLTRRFDSSFVVRNYD